MGIAALLAIAAALLLWGAVTGERRSGEVIGAAFSDLAALRVAP